MQKNILITGASGFLGGRLAAHWADVPGWHVTTLSHAEADLTNAQTVLRAVAAINPNAVIHCAGIADTGFAEAHPQESYAVNVQAAVHIAQACLNTGAQMLYMSSDQVYNGSVSLQPQPETASLTPENVYGWHKLEAENAVQALLPNAVALRLTWLYDLPVQGQKTSSNLLCNLVRAALRGEMLKFPVRQLRGVTWVRRIVTQLPALLTLPGGVYNAGSTCVPDETAYETALFAAKQLGAPHPEVLVAPDFARFAAHVCNLNMNTQKLAAYGVHFSPNRQDIATCLQTCGWSL